MVSLRCLLKERRIFLIFGVVYCLGVIGVFYHGNQLDSAKISVSREIDVPHDKSKESLPAGKPSPLTARPAERDIRVATAARRAPKPLALGAAITAENCSKLPKPTFLEAGTLPLTALSSFPGSGNTWMRVLLSSLTGYNTGDIYKDGSFSKTPGFVNKKDDTVIAIKTHHPFWDDNNGPDPSAPKNRYWERAIVVVRHPLDATISGFSFFKTRGSHTKTATMEKFVTGGKPTKEWNKWAHDQIRNWGRCLEYWVNVFKGPLHIVFYENLKDDLTTQLVDLDDFLNVPLDPARLNCTLISNSQTKFKRGKTIDKRMVYDASMLNEVEVVLERTRSLLLANYTHNSNNFHWPNSYSTNLIRENFSVKPS